MKYKIDDPVMVRKDCKYENGIHAGKLGIVIDIETTGNPGCRCDKRHPYLVQIIDATSSCFHANELLPALTGIQDAPHKPSPQNC